MLRELSAKRRAATLFATIRQLEVDSVDDALDLFDLFDLREQTREIQRLAFVAVLGVWSAAPHLPAICRCFVVS
ncbi:MAG: hypothetical protein ACLP0J_09850 [Solirubrobacteraceae bacterium]|jgi:hypothetical protein